MAVPGIIALFGPPGSGKTTLSVKLGIELAAAGKTVAVICCDNVTPALPVLFPTAVRNELRSMGEIFTASDITEKEILSSAYVTDEFPDMIYFGYVTGDNSYTWPSFSERRAGSMLEAALKTVNTVIVDCCSNIESDALTVYALKNAGTVINIYTPNLKTVSFYESQLPLVTRLGNNDCLNINILNHPTNDVYLPTDEMNDYIADKVQINYSKTLKQQFIEGKTVKYRADKKTASILKQIIASSAVPDS